MHTASDVATCQGMLGQPLGSPRAPGGLIPPWAEKDLVLPSQESTAPVRPEGPSMIPVSQGRTKGLVGGRGQGEGPVRENSLSDSVSAHFHPELALG